MYFENGHKAKTTNNENEQHLETLPFYDFPGCGVNFLENLYFFLQSCLKYAMTEEYQ